MSSYLDQLIEKTAEHLLLTGLATAVAVLIGIPLAIAIRNHPRAKSLGLGVVGVFQTIPSLALLVFFLPFFGIGTLPAILALIIYALLPIVRNTVTGLEEVPWPLLDAADGLGFTGKQKLLQIELPLALPVIIAGIRTSAVIGVGIATLAAFVGAGGLGDFITRGLAINSNEMILKGAIPAAVLALLIDFSLARWTSLSSPSVRRDKRRFRRDFALAIASIILLVAPLVIYAADSIGESRKETVVVASKNFSEQFILGELIALSIEHFTDLRVERKLNLGSVSVCHRALVHGEVDIYPEYTGTAFRVILEREEALSAEEIYQQTKSEYVKRFEVEWLKPFGFNNTYALAVRSDFAREHDLKSISDLVPLASELSIAMAPEFHERPDGYANFSRKYGLRFESVEEMDLALVYQALSEGEVDALVGNSTDGRMRAFSFTILDDDLGFFPPYYAAPIVRADTLARFPEIERALAPLAGALDEQTIQALNLRVDLDNESARDVAREFLENLWSGEVASGA